MMDCSRKKGAIIPRGLEKLECVGNENKLPSAVPTPYQTLGTRLTIPTNALLVVNA